MEVESDLSNTQNTEPGQQLLPFVNLVQRDHPEYHRSRIYKKEPRGKQVAILVRVLETAHSCTQAQVVPQVAITKPRKRKHQYSSSLSPIQEDIADAKRESVDDKTCHSRLDTRAKEDLKHVQLAMRPVDTLSRCGAKHAEGETEGSSATSMKKFDDKKKFCNMWAPVIARV